MNIGQMKAYNSLLIVEKLVNEVPKNTALPAVLCGLCIHQILVFYGSLKTISNYSQTPTLCMFFIVCYLNLSIGTILAHTIAAKLFTTSSRVLKSWKKGIPSWNKLKKRQMNSLVPLRIKCFNNFIDSSTPLVAQNFIAGQTASLILMQ